jgi:hypothetical protein
MGRVSFWGGGGHKWKEFIVKKNNTANPQKQGEHHQVLKVSIDEALSRPIITPPNKIVNSNTNSLVPTPTPIILLKRMLFHPKGLFN